jgi:hypothetical protein
LQKKPRSKQRALRKAAGGAERGVHRVRLRRGEREGWAEEDLAVGAAEVGAWLVTFGLGRFGFLALVFGELLIGVAVGIA